MHVQMKAVPSAGTGRPYVGYAVLKLYCSVLRWGFRAVASV